MMRNLLGISFLSTLLICVPEQSNAWVVRSRVSPLRTASASFRTTSSNLQPWKRQEDRTNNNRQQQPLQIPPSFQRKSTALSMYNLPPGGGNNNKVGQIAQSVLILTLTIAFFLSPLGGIVVSLLNSFLFLIFLTPLVGGIVFQVWRYFNILEAPCPNCAAPASVLKTKENQPDQVSVCFNCGASLQANYENDQIVNVSGKGNIMDEDEPFGGIWDMFSGFGGNGGTTTTTTTTTTETDVYTDKDKRAKRETTIIDVDATRDDKPWQ